MKIFYWTSLWWPDLGGLEVLAMETVAELKRRGHELLVVTDAGYCGAPPYSEWEGVPIHRFPFLKTLTERNLPQVMKLEREISALAASFAADVTHLNFGGSSLYFYLRTRRAYPTPELLVAHSDFSQVAKHGADSVFGRFLRNCDWLCGVSRATLDGVLAFVPEKAPRSSVIHNGLAMPDIAATPLAFEPPHILAMGRIERDKGFDIALRTFVRLRQRFPAARLTIAGDGSERRPLESLATQLGLDARAIFVGRLERDEIAPMINSATLVLVPSRYREPFALVALEAAQMARPVVATRWGGLVESVADGESGILVENEDVAAFADAMEFLIDNPDKARAMGARGRERACELFSLERCVSEYEALYQRLAE